MDWIVPMWFWWVNILTESTYVFLVSSFLCNFFIYKMFLFLCIYYFYFLSTISFTTLFYEFCKWNSNIQKFWLCWLPYYHFKWLYGWVKKLFYNFICKTIFHLFSSSLVFIMLFSSPFTCLQCSRCILFGNVFNISLW
jgi:hypothetical protein